MPFLAFVAYLSFAQTFPPATLQTLMTKIFEDFFGLRLDK